VIRGRAFTPSGKSHSWETPTTWSIKPSAAAISVAAGKSETMRVTSQSTWFFLPEQGKSMRRGKE
jgi:hypothetical protein